MASIDSFFKFVKALIIDIFRRSIFLGLVLARNFSQPGFPRILWSVGNSPMLPKKIRISTGLKKGDDLNKKQKTLR
jgi:hypothetical protein